MAVIPERILQRAIVNGILALREDDRVFDALFRNLNQNDQQGIKKTLLDNAIDFSINYPRKEPSLPSVVLLLKSESESDGFLGDMMGVSPNYFVPDTDLTISTLGGGHATSVSTLRGLPRKVLGNIEVANTATTSPGNIQIAENSLADWVEFYKENGTNGGLPNYWDVHVIQGTGIGQKKQIEKIFSNFLDIIGTFEVDLDSTSVIDIRLHEDPTLAEGEPSRVYDEDGSYARKGAYYEIQYTLDILASQQEQVIYLYYVLKAILISQRQFLELQGVIGLTIGGSDFAKKSDFIPDEVFQRNMTLTFKSEFSYLEVIPTYSNLTFNLCVDDQNSTELASSTTFPISV